VVKCDQCKSEFWDRETVNGVSYSAEEQRAFHTSENKKCAMFIENINYLFFVRSKTGNLFFEYTGISKEGVIRCLVHLLHMAYQEDSFHNRNSIKVFNYAIELDGGLSLMYVRRGENEATTYTSEYSSKCILNIVNNYYFY